MKVVTFLIVSMLWLLINVVPCLWAFTTSSGRRMTKKTKTMLLLPPMPSYFRITDEDDESSSEISSWALYAQQRHQQLENEAASSSSRRNLLVALSVTSSLALLLSTAGSPWSVQAADQELAVLLDMKTFVDPQGLFTLRIPKDFFALRRLAKGDLPDEKTGAGRRGSSIFSAGNMAKAEIVAIERYPVRVLLEENGIQATGSLQTFPDIGEPSAVANLIALRRDKDKAGQSNTQIIPNSLYISQDGKELQFKLRTEIEVQKPELLQETYGVSQLFRITTAKASLRANDGNLMAIFASALEKDYMGPDGVALQEAVDSFQVTER